MVPDAANTAIALKLMCTKSCLDLGDQYQILSFFQPLFTLK